MPAARAKVYAHVLDFFGSMFELRDGNFELIDSDGDKIIAKRRLIAQTTIKDGRVWYQRPAE